MSRQTKIPVLLYFGAVASAILHNVIYAIFKFEEPVFFCLTFLLVIGFLGTVGYNIYTYLKKGEPKDLWKLGFLGFIGFLGIFAFFKPIFFGFLPFLLFFLLLMFRGEKNEKKNSTAKG